MSWLQKVKSSNQGRKDLIFGFIRESSKSISYTTIPVMINYICLLYYIVKDKFIKTKMEITSSDTNNTEQGDIALLDPSNHQLMRWLTAHGNIIMNPTENPNVIATWTIKVDTGLCTIGIDSEYVDPPPIYIYTFYETSRWYRWDGWDGMQNDDRTQNKKQDKDKFKRGDVIKMQLDVPNKKLIFYRNDKRTNIVFDDIDVSKNYHLEINVYCHGIRSLATQIIDFNVINHNSLTFYSK